MSKMCSNEELKEAIENLEKSLVTSLIASRDKNHTMSEIMLSFQEKLDAHAEENNAQFKRIEKKIDNFTDKLNKLNPVAKMVITAQNTRRGAIWIAGFGAAVGVIMGTLYKMKEWLTK